MDTSQPIFDLSLIAEQNGISLDTLSELVEKAHEEFDEDEMMVELHVLRAIRRNYSEEKRKAARA